MSRAIELNNVAVKTNKMAFACGRLMEAAPTGASERHLAPKPEIATDA
jgi:hypothetical protein